MSRTTVCHTSENLTSQIQIHPKNISDEVCSQFVTRLLIFSLLCCYSVYASQNWTCCSGLCIWQAEVHLLSILHGFYVTTLSDTVQTLYLREACSVWFAEHHIVFDNCQVANQSPYSCCVFPRSCLPPHVEVLSICLPRLRLFIFLYSNHARHRGFTQIKCTFTCRFSTGGWVIEEET